MMRTVILGIGALLASCSAQPHWYKGNLHTHSLWSDGNDFPEVIARWYKERGYHFLALSDHNVIADHEKWMKVDDVVRRGARTGVQRYREQFGREWVETREVDGKLQVRLRRLDEWKPLLEEPGAFLIVTSEEITDKFDKRSIHINATNIGERIGPQGGDSVQEVMRNNLLAVAEQSERLQQPIVAHLNHPNFQWSVTAEDLAAVTEEQFFEICNGHPDTRQHGDDLHVSLEKMWDIANALRIAQYEAAPLFGLGTDDCHNYFNDTGSTPGRAWVMVRAEDLSPAALCAALGRGDFYSSSGVILDDVVYSGDTLQLHIREEPAVHYRTRFIGTRRGVSLDSEPVRDGDGNVVAGVTQRYEDGVGAVLAIEDGVAPSYRLRGDELYVRAVVTADREVPNPAWEGQRAQAWTQPVGWR